VLKFRGVFFTDITDARRENLLAFEGGRVFWNLVKNKPLKTGGTVESWWNAFYGDHSSIWEMKAAMHKGDALGELSDNDPGAMMAYVFRAEALGLEKPADSAARRDWEEVARAFDQHVGNLL
jgi:hypothetical protein